MDARTPLPAFCGSADLDPGVDWVFHSQGLYRKRDDVRFISDIRRVSFAVAAGAAAFILLGWPIKVSVPRGVVASS